MYLERNSAHPGVVKPKKSIPEHIGFAAAMIVIGLIGILIIACLVWLIVQVIGAI